MKISPLYFTLLLVLHKIVTEDANVLTQNNTKNWITQEVLLAIRVTGHALVLAEIWFPVSMAQPMHVFPVLSSVGVLQMELGYS